MSLYHLQGTVPGASCTAYRCPPPLPMPPPYSPSATGRKSLFNGLRRGAGRVLLRRNVDMEASALSSWQVPGRIACCSHRSFPAPGRGGGPGALQVRRGVGAPPDPPLSSPLRSQMAARKEGRGPQGGTIKAICGTEPFAPLPTNLGADGERGNPSIPVGNAIWKWGKSGGKGPCTPPPHHHHHPLPPHGAEAGGEGGGWLGGCALTLHLVTFNERGLLCTKRALGGCITHGYGEGISTAPTWGGAPGTR